MPSTPLLDLFNSDVDKMNIMLGTNNCMASTVARSLRGFPSERAA